MTEPLIRSDGGLSAVRFEGDDFTALLDKEFRPKSEEARSAVESAVQVLASQALADVGLIGADTIASIEALIAALDRRLSAQVNLVLHHAEFQRLESAWRGTHFDLVVLQMLKQIGVDMPSVYFEIVLGSAFITKISTKGAEDGSMTQDIELVFKEIIVNYKAQRNVGGGLDATKEFAWDIPSMQNSAPSIAGAVKL